MSVKEQIRLLDYSRYALRSMASNISDLEAIFSQQAWPVIHASLSRNPQLDFLSQHPWLRPLAAAAGSLDEIVVTLSQGYNQPTLTMLELDTLSSNHYVASLFKSRLTSMLASKAAWLLSQATYPQDAAKDLPKVFNYFQEVIRPLKTGDPLEALTAEALPVASIEGLSFVTTEARRARQYRVVLAKRLEQLCLTVGVPEPCVNPRSSIYSLRKFLSSRPQVAFGREASLQFQVDQLTERTRWQGRAITNLMYMRLMERLPETGSANPGDSRDRWAAFLAEAVQNAQLSGSSSGQTSSHPLAALLTRPNESATSEQIIRLGRQLFDSIDNNLRSSRIEYRPASDQWDADPLALLQALKPVSYLSSGEIDWEAERQRFLTPSTSSAQPATQERAVEPHTVQLPAPNEAGRPPPYSTV